MQPVEHSVQKYHGYFHRLDVFDNFIHKCKDAWAIPKFPEVSATWFGGRGKLILNPLKLRKLFNLLHKYVEVLRSEIFAEVL